MPADKSTIFDPSEIIPFNGYRRFFVDEEPIFDLVPSLLHFYESEKFRGVDEYLRMLVLQASTSKEVLKITKKNTTSWRKDWKAVRGRVFRAGIAMQAFGSKKAMTSARNAFNNSMEIASYSRIGGLPGPFIADELQRYFQPSAGPGVARMGVIALNGCVPTDIEQRLNSLFSKEKPLSAAIYSGGDADPTIEKWCAQSGIPIRITSQSSKRLREEDAKAITARINTLVCCMPKLRKGPQAILLAASERKPKIQIIDLTAKKIQ